MRHLNIVPLKIRFIAVGGLNTAISYLMFLSFICLFDKENYQKSLAFSWFLSSFISFTMQKIIVFQTEGKWLIEYIKCLLSWSIAYVINAILLEIGVKYMRVSAPLTQLVAVCFTTVLTFVLFKYFAFKKGNTNA